MKTIHSKSILIFSLLFITSCLKEVDPVAEFEPQVFIYGYLVDYTENIKVTVQRTTPVHVETLDPIIDASIALYTEDASGNTSLITDNFTFSDGDYYSDEKVTGLVGNKYWIVVSLQDGTTYESAHEELKPRVLITDIDKVDGFSRVIFQDPEGEANFYLIRYDFYQDNEFLETRFELSNDNLFDGNPNAFVEVDYTEGNGIGGYIQHLNYLTYQYYVTSFEQYENQVDFGSPETVEPFLIFSKPPVNLIGNIMNTTTNRSALGFFGVFSVDYREAIFN